MPIRCMLVQTKDVEFIDSLLQRTSNHMSLLDRTIETELALYSKSSFYEPIRYAIKDGKRIRPLILLLSTESVGGSIEEALRPAVAVELLHTESIIHDDIIDNESSRRSKAAFHVKYGYNASLLTADFVFGIILDIAATTNNFKVAQEISSAALKMCEGEFSETEIDTRQHNLTWDEYILLISRKTASLFQAAARIGAIVAHGNKEEIRALSDYGLNIGIAYQIQDDTIDWGEKGKATAALNINKPNVFGYLAKMAQSYATIAKDSLKNLTDSQSKNMLLEIAEFAIHRSY
jgi:octaprenyl-diphosphate synthase